MRHPAPPPRATHRAIAVLSIALALAITITLGACSSATPPTAATTATTTTPGLESLGTDLPRSGLDLPTDGGPRLDVPTTVPQSLNLPGFSASIDLRRCELNVSIENSAIGFGPDSAVISPDGQRKLALVGEQLQGAAVVTVVGFTSTEGSTEHNATLSEQRARAVAAVLAPLVPQARFDVRGDGEAHPLIPDDDTEAERALNRRVNVQARIEAEVCTDGTVEQP